jgi:hypothetical protein
MMDWATNPNMRNKVPTFGRLTACITVLCVGVYASKSNAVFFDMRGLTPSESYTYSLSVGGIGVQVGASGWLLKSGQSTLGIDGTGQNDNPLLIDGGTGSSENFAFLFSQDVFFESILVSEFDAVDSGSFNIKGAITVPLANGLNNVGVNAAKGSAHFLRWTGDFVSGMGRGFSVDGFSVRPSSDYNNNGIVDAADYLLWRKSNGAPFEYTAWRRNFGTGMSLTGSGTAYSTVPEPSTVFFLMSLAVGAFAALPTRRRKSASHNPV